MSYVRARTGVRANAFCREAGGAMTDECLSSDLDCLHMRLFVAIPVPEDAANALSEIVSKLRSSNDGLRWTTAASWHVTLQFLGHVNEELLPNLTSALSRTRMNPFAVHFDGIGSFERVGVLFAGIVPSEELIDLQKQVTDATRTCGFEEDARPYCPHLTLARGKGRKVGRSLRTFKMGNTVMPKLAPFQAHEFCLFESFLSQMGSKYEIRQRFPLD
jgi:RNA 2',3'-cyclic 3'-phosphodiesterase